MWAFVSMNDPGTSSKSHINLKESLKIIKHDFLYHLTKIYVTLFVIREKNSKMYLEIYGNTSNDATNLKFQN